MKTLPVLFVLTAIPVHGALVSWVENFESFDTSKDALELQNPDWWTGPAETNSIAVIPTEGSPVPSSFQNQSLAIGGVTPVFNPMETNTSVVYLLAPLSASFTPAAGEPLAKLHFDLWFSSGETGTSLVDDFRLNFVDQTNAAWSSLLFSPALDAGIVTIYRYNNVDAFATGAIIPINAGVSLDILMDLESNKWSASLGQIDGGETVSLFSSVDINADLLNNTAADLGSFSMDWMKSGETWDDNFMLVDNVSIESMASVPEPGTIPLWCVFFTTMLIWRRNRQVR